MCPVQQSLKDLVMSEELRDAPLFPASISNCSSIPDTKRHRDMCTGTRTREAERERERERGQHAQGRVGSVHSVTATTFGWIGRNEWSLTLPSPSDPAPRISPSPLHAFGSGSSPIMYVSTHQHLPVQGRASGPLLQVQGIFFNCRENCKNAVLERDNATVLYRLYLYSVQTVPAHC